MIRRALLLAVATAAIAVPSAHAAFPGTNGRIAFTSSADGDSEIYTINPNGTGLVQLTNNTIADGQASWSPDGQQIVFARENGSDVDIWKMNADGSGQALVIDYPGAPGFTPTSPAWSADQQKIVFGVRDPDPSDICPGEFTDDVCDLFTVNPDGSGLASFAGSIDESCCPTWSPDGGRVAWSAVMGGLPGLFEVWVKTIGGSTISIGGPSIEDSNLDPDWSPNAQKLVYTYVPETGGGLVRDLYTANPDGSGRAILRAGAQHPAWSPDGTKIAFFDSSGPPAGVWTADSDGGGATFLAEGSAPAWQPLPINYYARPKGATPILASLVTAYKPCSSPDRTHGPPLAFGSCSSPQMASDHLTVGTGDSNGKPARSEGEVRIQAIVGNPANPADEADVAMGFLMNDVYTKAMVDYDGELRVRLTIQITDKNNTPHPSAPGGAGAATTTEIPIEMVALCSPTINIPDEGSYCSFSTSADTLAPGSVREGRRTIWQMQDIEVYDGGADGDADTPSGDTLFATKGLFIP